MKADDLNAIVGAAIAAVESSAPELAGVRAEPPRRRERPEPDRPLAIVLAVKGDLEAQIVLSMDLSVGIQIADAVLRGEGEYASGFTELEQSVLKEMATQLGSHLSVELSERGLRVRVSAPHLSFAKKLRTAIPGCEDPVVVTLQTPVGAIDADVAVAAREEV